MNAQEIKKEIARLIGEETMANLIANGEMEEPTELLEVGIEDLQIIDHFVDAADPNWDGSPH